MAWRTQCWPEELGRGGTKKAAERAVKEAKAKFAPHTPARKDRLRPRAKPPPIPAPKPPAQPMPSFWSCRPNGKRQRFEGRAEAPERVLLTREDLLALKAQLVEVQANCCALCGDYMAMDEMDHPIWRVTIDHTYPRYSGGGNTGNIVGAHQQCNADKANDFPTGCELVWLAFVNSRLEVPLPDAKRIDDKVVK